ncbi:unnamed protein product, partial [Rodentolepis nana]|uniref:Cadherin domain-containing protein n=1 Tax=Rodentolepis nana TaxID=102285 RepID=A0A0R3T493_RODNA
TTEIKNVFVTVKVIDVNDERPVFVPFWAGYPDSIAKAVLSEESKTPPGTRVFQVQAMDADAKALLEFRWTPGLDTSVTKRFSISPTSVRILFHCSLILYFIVLLLHEFSF